MNRFATAIQNDLNLIKLLRDEAALQAHLLKADARRQWDKLESDWNSLKEHVGRAQTAAGSAQREAETAAQLLIQSLREGYANVGKALKH